MDKNQIREIVLEILAEQGHSVSQLDIRPTVVKALHVEDAIIRIGLAAKRPTSGSPSCRAFFSTDTFVLSIWTGSAWKSTSALS